MSKPEHASGKTSTRKTSFERLGGIADSFLGGSAGEQLPGATKTSAPEPAAGSQMLEVLLQESRETHAQARAAGKLREIDIGLVDPDPLQPRKTFNEAELATLKSTIAAHGVIQPPTVRQHPEAIGRFMIVTGERRWRGCKLLGHKTIEVKFVEMDDRHARMAQLIENCDQARAGVAPWQEAQAYHALVQEVGSARDLAKMMGLGDAYISKRLALLNLPNEIKELIELEIITDNEKILVLKRMWDRDESQAKKVIAEAKKAGGISRDALKDAYRDVARPRNQFFSRATDPTLKPISDILGRNLEQTFEGSAKLRALKKKNGSDVVLITIECGSMEMARVFAEFQTRLTKQAGSGG